MSRAAVIFVMGGVAGRRFGGDGRRVVGRPPPEGRARAPPRRRGWRVRRLFPLLPRRTRQASFAIKRRSERDRGALNWDSCARSFLLRPLSPNNTTVRLLQFESLCNRVPHFFFHSSVESLTNYFLFHPARSGYSLMPLLLM